MNHSSNAILDICQEGNHFSYLSNIDDAIAQAELELLSIEETIDSVNVLKPQCDKLDYALSASSGALCGIFDIFLVGKPKASLLGESTDKWLEHRICDFAKKSGWKGNKDDESSLKKALKHLEDLYKVPYDQRGAGDAGSEIFGLSPQNHHFKSLGHNPSLLGLFFSILDQFTNSSHFISGGELIELVEANGKFELKGNSVPGKIISGFVNWFRHLISDVSGSSGSATRGSGIPSPLWNWCNSIIAIKAKLNIPINQFDKDVCDLALEIYNEGFDFRFFTTQTIPVIANELIVRFFYSTRRLLKYYKTTEKSERTFKDLWKACEPFSNPTIKRMLTVAHGTFCLVDITDATIRGFATGGGTFNPVEFLLRLNIAGLGRFTICLFGEAKRAINIHYAQIEADHAKLDKTLLEYYLEGLNELKIKYDDQEYLTFIDDLQNSHYISAFNKTISLARLRGVPDPKILTTKEKIDRYFNN